MSWQPLQIPSEKVSSRSKNLESSARTVGWNLAEAAQP
eukprot:COSAG01_NODE_13_length_41723_cov_145.394556_26_plen_38_part_00